MIRYLLACLWWEIRWWIWMWRDPNIWDLISIGVDKQSRRLIYRRSDATAPQKPKREDYGIAETARKRPVRHE